MVQLLLEFNANADIETDAGRPIDLIAKGSGSMIRRILVTGTFSGSSLAFQSVTCLSLQRRRDLKGVAEAGIGQLLNLAPDQLPS
jgi:hypothetical protein